VVAETPKKVNRIVVYCPVRLDLLEGLKPRFGRATLVDKF